MSHYLLSVHSVEGQMGEPMTEEQRRESSRQVEALEADMKSSDTFVFGGRLTAADDAIVVRVADGDVLSTDGPFAESKEQLGGFYLIEADDHEAALAWAGRVTAVIKHPIEVRPFWGVTEA